MRFKHDVRIATGLVLFFSTMFEPEQRRVEAPHGHKVELHLLLLERHRLLLRVQAHRLVVLKHPRQLRVDRLESSGHFPDLLEHARFIEFVVLPHLLRENERKATKVLRLLYERNLQSKTYVCLSVANA